MSHCAFMGKGRKEINVATVDLVCSVEDERTIKKKGQNLI